jgi:hypothetical protein
MNEPSGVERLIFQIRRGHQNGIAVPPQRALGLADAREEIDHAQVHLQQADGEVGATPLTASAMV